ncbi:phosphoglucosamine mutase, partial [Methylococcaceae bacterium HT1]
IVISASHNPYYDNGIKFFSTEGTKLADKLEHKIEYYLDQPMTTVASDKLGKAKRLPDASGRYIEFCKASIPASIDFNGLRIVVDCANGSTYHIAPHVFSEVGAEVIEVAVSPDGLNINENCGATKPELLQEAVIEYRADLGIALDGDGDRLIMVDHKGEVVDGDELIFIIAKASQSAGTLKGPVVGTLMSNLGMEHALKSLNIDLLRANVGDRYVMELMKQQNSILGGEGSGHIICLDRTTTGDGIVAALQVLTEIHKTGKSLYELKSEMRKYPQVLLNVKVSKKVDLASNEAIQKSVKTAEKALGDQGRVLLRASGTEPLIRVMVEGADEVKVRKYAHSLVDDVKNAITA